MKIVALSIAALSLQAVPASASEVFNQSGYSIHQLNDVVYEAVSEGWHGGAAFWCAAGTFAQVKLGASARDSIYVVRGAGPSETTNRRSAAQFTLNAKAAGVTPVEQSDNLNEPNIGEHMQVNVARNFCG